MRYSVIFMTYNQKDMFDKFADSVKDYDVEIIISDDGSTDGSKEEAIKRGWTVTGNKENKGFDIITGANQAGVIAKGQYLVMFTGDTYPHKEFISKIEPHLNERRLLNGLRLQVNENGTIIDNDWRVKRMPPEAMDLEYIPMEYDGCWELMQSNGLVMSKDMYNDLGGMLIDYRYHAGACDTDLCAHAYFKGYDLGIVPDAVCYHRFHKENFDDKYSEELKAKRIKEFREVYA